MTEFINIFCIVFICLIPSSIAWFLIRIAYRDCFTACREARKSLDLANEFRWELDKARSERDELQDRLNNILGFENEDWKP